MIYAPVEEPGITAPPGLPVRVRTRIAAPPAGLRILRVAVSIAAVLLIGIAVWVGRSPGVGRYEHVEGGVEDVRISLDLRGSVTVAEGGNRFDLLHSAEESYEQRIVRLDGSRPAEVERRHAGSDLVVRLRQTPAGKTEVAHLAPSGAVELLSVSDNLAVDEACELLAPDGSGVRAEAVRRIVARMLPKSLSIDSFELASRPEGTGLWSLGGTAELQMAVSQDRCERIEIGLSGNLQETDSTLALELQARIGPEASLRFALRRTRP